MAVLQKPLSQQAAPHSWAVIGRVMLAAGTVSGAGATFSGEHPLPGHPTEPWDMDMLAGLVLENHVGLVQQDQLCAYKIPKGAGTTWLELSWDASRQRRSRSGEASCCSVTKECTKRIMWGGEVGPRGEERMAMHSQTQMREPSAEQIQAVTTCPGCYRAGREPLPTQRALQSSRQTACSPKTATCERFLLQAEAWLCTPRGEPRHSSSPQLMARRGFGQVSFHLTPQGDPASSRHLLSCRGCGRKGMAWSRGSVRQLLSWSKCSLQLQSLLSQRKYPMAPGPRPAPQGCPGMEHVTQPCFPRENCPEGNTAREWGHCGGLMCTQ